MTITKEPITLPNLSKLNLQRLYNLKNKQLAAVKYISENYGARCCEICNEYIGGDWENDVERHKLPYLSAVKLISAEIYRQKSSIRAK
jgi:hypothetical protein